MEKIQKQLGLPSKKNDSSSIIGININGEVSFDNITVKISSILFTQLWQILL